MGKKLERVFRDRPLTAEERAEDAEVRQEVEREFPPSQPVGNGIVPTVGRASSLSELLRRAIRESGRATDDIARQAGVSPVLVAQFLSGERDIHMMTADKLADAMGLKISAN